MNNAADIRMAKLLFRDVEGQIGVIWVANQNLAFWAFILDARQQSSFTGRDPVRVFDGDRVSELVHLFVCRAGERRDRRVRFVNDVAGITDFQPELLNRAVVPDFAPSSHHGKFATGGAVRDAEMIRRPLQNRFAKQAKLI